MPAITSTAPGKIILFGEHAVVYNRPAIAVPLVQVRARVTAMAEPRWKPGRVMIQAADLNQQSFLDELPQTDPLGLVAHLVLSETGIDRPPACTLRISSTIPIAAGLGSGAAVSVAMIRSFAEFLGRPLSNERVSALAYEVERTYHGTPSGIDNTVITYQLPVFFVRGQPIEVLNLPAPFTIIVADTGIRSQTASAVGDVRQAWERQPDYFESLFDEIGEIAREARRLIENGQPLRLGPLMDRNHELLCALGVSCLELDRLAQAARSAGALGAKLSGGGQGGNMIALVKDDDTRSVEQALRRHGAVQMITTRVSQPGGH